MARPCTPGPPSRRPPTRLRLATWFTLLQENIQRQAMVLAQVLLGQQMHLLHSFQMSSGEPYYTIREVFTQESGITQVIILPFKVLI